MLLYRLFTVHGMTPGSFYSLPPGERMLVSAFATWRR
nr:MAG TPA: hypothetical protein [Caudoviricetes sp.]